MSSLWSKICLEDLGAWLEDKQSGRPAALGRLQDWVGTWETWSRNSWLAAHSWPHAPANLHSHLDTDVYPHWTRWRHGCFSQSIVNITLSPLSLRWSHQGSQVNEPQGLSLWRWGAGLKPGKCHLHSHTHALTWANRGNQSAMESRSFRLNVHTSSAPWWPHIPHATDLFRGT